MVTAVFAIALGAALGFGVGATNDKNAQWNMAVRDGKDIYQTLQDSSGTIDSAQKHLKASLKAATPGPAQEAAVNYEAIEALVALKKPFEAGVFSRKRYLAFQPGAVDDLFMYHNNIQTLWERFGRLAAMTAGKNRREILDKAAGAADSLARQQYGLVINKAGGAYVGGLVYVTIPPRNPEDSKKAKDGPLPVKVSSRLGGRQVERHPYVGYLDFAEKPERYVILVDKARSMSILGAAADPFARYRLEVQELSTLVEKTVVIQGRLLTELGKVAALKEQFAL